MAIGDGTPRNRQSSFDVPVGVNTGRPDPMEQAARNRRRGLQRAYRRAVRSGDHRTIGELDAMGVTPHVGGANVDFYRKFDREEANVRRDAGNQIYRQKDTANEIENSVSSRPKPATPVEAQESAEGAPGEKGPEGQAGEPGRPESPVERVDEGIAEPPVTSSERRRGESVFDFEERIKREKLTEDGAFGRKMPSFGDSRSKFESDLAASELLKNNDPDAWERAYQRGDRLGYDQSAIDGMTGRSTPSPEIGGAPSPEIPEAALEVMRAAKEKGEAARKEVDENYGDLFGNLDRMVAEDYDGSDPRNYNRAILEKRESLASGTKFNKPKNTSPELDRMLQNEFSDFLKSSQLKTEAAISSKKLNDLRQNRVTSKLEESQKTYDTMRNDYWRYSPEQKEVALHNLRMAKRDYENFMNPQSVF